MKVKCRGCGTEYEMPNIGQPVIMNDCPVCKELKTALEKAMK